MYMYQFNCFVASYSGVENNNTSMIALKNSPKKKKKNETNQTASSKDLHKYNHHR